MIETGIIIKGNITFVKNMFIYYSIILRYIEARGADRGIDIGIVIDRVVREDLFRGRRVKIRKITGKICPKLRLNGKIRRNRKMLYL